MPELRLYKNDPVLCITDYHLNPFLIVNTELFCIAIRDQAGVFCLLIP